MKVLIDTCFKRDTDKITDKKILNSIADCIKNFQNVERLKEIANCKKLKGSRNSYRIRIGDYRIGFIYEKKIATFIRVLHRNKIYDFFS